MLVSKDRPHRLAVLLLGAWTAGQLPTMRLTSTSPYSFRASPRFVHISALAIFPLDNHNFQGSIGIGGVRPYLNEAKQNIYGRKMSIGMHLVRTRFETLDELGTLNSLATVFACMTILNAPMSIQSVASMNSSAWIPMSWWNLRAPVHRQRVQ